MKNSSVLGLETVYVHPRLRTPLFFDGELDANGRLSDGILRSNKGAHFFPVARGVPDFVDDNELVGGDLEALNWYRTHYLTYDENLPLTFRTFGVDEGAFREGLIDRLRLKPTDRVLETGCGTGRDSFRISARLNEGGALYAQDLSAEILGLASGKLANGRDSKVEFSRSNASALPFSDGFFDASFHFGGFNTFEDKAAGFAEMLRVTKPGGMILVGDESMPPWLRATEFGEILMNSNPHYRFELPLNFLPVEARNVVIEYVLGGVFYVITFIRGDGPPVADIDFEIPGIRGGTHRKRYYGQLEGVDLELKNRIIQAAREKQISVVTWLEDALGKALRDAP